MSSTVPLEVKLIYLWHIFPPEICLLIGSQYVSFGLTIPTSASSTVKDASVNKVINYWFKQPQLCSIVSNFLIKIKFHGHAIPAMEIL